jgi:hypothetical protein
MPPLPQIIKMVAVLAAAALIGNWFLHELRNARRARKPWYAVYRTPPGILIILSVALLPLVIWYLGRP